MYRLLDRIAGNVDRLRKAQDWSQAETAENLGCDLRWFQRLTSGKHVISLDTITRLSKVFRVDESEFFKAP